ncbi:MAG: TlpA family protein disulfide reductase [Lewinella sp.]
MRLITAFIIVVTGLLLTHCEAPAPNGASADAIEVLEATRSKMLNTPTHHYRFASFWDNRFASSTYTETMNITYSWLPDSDLGFGFYAAGKDAGILYDGKDKLKIDHIKRKVIRTTAADINKDPANFANLMCFHGDPKALPEAAALDRITDTVIAGKPMFVYAINLSTPSAGTSNVTTREYYLDPALQVVDRIRKISHTGSDTTQVIDYVFSDYVFSEEYHEFGADDRTKSLAYREVSKADDKKERRSGLIRPGAQLHRADYTDIEGKQQLLYGKAGKKTVVMFGFIGCGNCEHAFREMKKKDFAIRSDVDLVYSSPVDEASRLRGYLSKKAFPFKGFGKESRMNDNFKAAGFPTFVLIDEAGGVEQVIGGYDEAVSDILFASGRN